MSRDFSPLHISWPIKISRTGIVVCEESSERKSGAKMNPDNDIQYAKFIEEELIPEMVFDRYFCEPGSREFVELKSVTVTNRELEFFAQVEIEFSGEPKMFSVLIKLLPKGAGSERKERFLVDVYFYKEMLQKYSIDLFAKCYLSNLGQVFEGKQLLVLENLVDSGWSNETKSLTKKQVELCFRMMARFHAVGLKLNKDEPEIFQQFKQNLYKLELGSVESVKYDQCIRFELSKQEMKFDADRSPIESLAEFHSQSDSPLHTICHGNWTHPNLFFKDEEMRIVNFESMIVSTIGFHLETFILNLKKTKSYFDTANCLKLYVRELNETVPEVKFSDVLDDMKKAQTFAFIHDFVRHSEICKTV